VIYTIDLCERQGILDNKYFYSILFSVCYFIYQIATGS